MTTVEDTQRDGESGRVSQLRRGVPLCLLGNGSKEEEKEDELEVCVLLRRLHEEEEEMRAKEYCDHSLRVSSTNK